MSAITSLRTRFTAARATFHDRFATARAAQRAANPQAGIGIGMILLIVILLVALGAAATRFSSDGGTPSTDAQRAQLDAGVLAKQVGELRDGLTLVSAAVTVPWSSYGPDANNRLVLSNGTSDVSDSSIFRQLPMGPVGADGSNVTWRISTPAADGAIYAYTSGNISSRVCDTINLQLRGSGYTTPANDTLRTALAGVTAQTDPVTTTYNTSSTTLATEAVSGPHCLVGTAGTDTGMLVARLR